MPRQTFNVQLVTQRLNRLPFFGMLLASELLPSSPLCPSPSKCCSGIRLFQYSSDHDSPCSTLETFFDSGVSWCLRRTSILSPRVQTFTFEICHPPPSREGTCFIRSGITFFVRLRLTWFSMCGKDLCTGTTKHLLWEIQVAFAAVYHVCSGVETGLKFRGEQSLQYWCTGNGNLH